MQKGRSSRNVPAATRFLLLVFIVCLRGAQPCTINPVSDRQTLLCLLFCCWLPPGRPCALLLHMLPSSPRTPRNGADVSSVAPLGRPCLKRLLIFRTNFLDTENETSTSTLCLSEGLDCETKTVYYSCWHDGFFHVEFILNPLFILSFIQYR